MRTIARTTSALHLVQVTMVLLALLDEAEAELAGAAAAHADELADDDPLRAERDEATSEVNGALLSLRSITTGVFGVNFAKRVGLHRRIEKRPDLVTKMAAGVVRLLRNAKAPARSFGGTQLELTELARELDVKVERLQKLLASVEREERQAEATMIARDQAAERWGHVVTLAAGWLEGLARIAGEHEIADRIRPTERRRTGLESSVDERADIDADADADAGTDETGTGTDDAAT